MKMRWLILVIVALLPLVGCNDDDESASVLVTLDDLVGTWVQSVPEDDTEYRFIFEKTTDLSGKMEWYWNVENETGSGWVTLMAAKATFVIEEQKIIPSVTHWGSQFIEFDDDQLLDEIVWYTFEDEEWDWFEMEDDLSIDFELKNGQFLHKQDFNDDGDYNDEGEIEIYVKV